MIDGTNVEKPRTFVFVKPTNLDEVDARIERQIKEAVVRRIADSAALRLFELSPCLSRSV